MKRRKRITLKPGEPDMRVEARQSRLAANTEAYERQQRRLFRVVNEMRKLAAERKRLLAGPRGKLKYRGEQLTGMGGTSELNDDLGGI